MLGIGGKDTETIIQVFQLNEEQVQKMEDLRAELSVMNKAYQEEIRTLFDSHPQSTTEELEALATKYKVLKDRVLENAMDFDIRMLKMFNPKQYDRYLELCASAKRIPYQVVPQPFPKLEPK
jgi:Spy/CpxP family protein refolding chaperone